MWRFKQPFFPWRWSSGHLEFSFKRFSDKFPEKKPKKTKKLLFSKTKKMTWIFYLEQARCSFENFLALLWKRGRKFWLKIRFWWKIFFPTKLICGHINCSFENCRKPFIESPKTFRPKSQNDKHVCSYFRKKNFRKEWFCSRRIHF